jgi:two-component system phosphate regulon sensor histidine kinase PhoR
LLALTLLTLALVIGLLGIYLSVVGRRHLLDLTLRGLQSQARLISAGLAGHLERPDGAGIDSLADHYARIGGYRVTIIDSTGRVLGDSDQDGAGLLEMDNHSGRPEIRGAAANGMGHSLRYSQTLNKQMIYLAVPLLHQGRRWGYCRVAWPFVDFDTYRRHLLTSLFLGLSLSALALFLLFNGYWSSILGSLKKLEQSAARISSGELSIRAPASHRAPEISLIAQSLNRLAQSWENSSRELRERTLHLRAVLEGMSQGVVVVDRNTRITLINHSAARMFGLGPEGTEGRLLIEAIRHPGIENWARTGTAESEFSVSGRIFSAYRSPLDQADPEAGTVLVISDMTEFRRLEGVRQDFVANVSHELKTPLSAILGYSQALRDGEYQGRAQLKDFLNRIHQQSERMSRIVSDLLTLAALEGGIHLARRPVRLGELLERAAENVQQQITGRKQSLSLPEGPAAATEVVVDEARMIQALTNLLDNASKYSPEGGSIKAAAEIGEGRVKISVTDTGGGISSEHLPRLFERFYRADKGRSRDLGGTGLGLAIVKHIVELHGGQIGVSSQLGQGSVFWVDLPA